MRDPVETCASITNGWLVSSSLSWNNSEFELIGDHPDVVFPGSKSLAGNA